MTTRVGSWLDTVMAASNGRLAAPEQEKGQSSRALEEEIESSKVHWSELRSEFGNEPSCLEEDTDSMLEMLRRKHSKINKEVFKTLQKQWPSLFSNSMSWRAEWKLQEKIAEGSQGEIYNVIPLGPAKSSWKWGSSRLVSKVFKLEGASLLELRKQWPLEYLKNHRNLYPIIQRGILLKDGRFAFLMEKHWGDLRKLMDVRMQFQKGPPFSIDLAFAMMVDIAHRMRELHDKHIVHRDLKASNVLIGVRGPSFDPVNLMPFSCLVADYECSIGVVGTGFWRAPEILRAVKDHSIDKKSQLFTPRADVYSYAMTCYEILTGKYPFEHLRQSDYEAVFSGREQLNWPLCIKSNLDLIPLKVKALLQRCSDLDPLQRPTFNYIAEEFCNLGLRPTADYLLLQLAD